LVLRRLCRGVELHLPATMDEGEQDLVLVEIVHEADLLAAEAPQHLCSEKILSQV
jgi:hypothetical protein